MAAKRERAAAKNSPPGEGAAAAARGRAVVRIGHAGGDGCFAVDDEPGVDAPEGLPSLDGLVNPELDLSDLDDLAAKQRLLADAGLI